MRQNGCPTFGGQEVKLKLGKWKVEMKRGGGTWGAGWKIKSEERRILTADGRRFTQIEEGIRGDCYLFKPSTPNDLLHLICVHLRPSAVKNS